MATTRAKEQRSDTLGFSVKTETTKELSTPSTDSSPARSRAPSRTCTHCERKGHEISECFLVHGFPEWYQDQQRQYNSSSGNRGGQGGRFNGSRGRGRGRANAAQSTPQFNSDQIAFLISLLQSQQSNLSSERLSGKTTFTDVIIDTGASHHMTGDLSLLRDVCDIPTSSVALFRMVGYHTQLNKAHWCLVKTILYMKFYIFPIFIALLSWSPSCLRKPGA